MDYSNVELDVVTIDDCLVMFTKKNITTVINDGHVINFIKEDKKMNDLVEQHLIICNKLNQIYEQKNKAYGNSFGETYDKLGIISAVTRISDKYNRLVNLATHSDINKGDEAIEDTLLDMANYCIMTYMEIKKENINDKKEYKVLTESIKDTTE